MTSGITNVGAPTQVPYTFAGAARSLTIPASGANAPSVGDHMTLWVSCSSALTGGTPAGWTLINSDHDSGSAEFIYAYGRYCQSGDPGSVVTLPSATAVVRCLMTLSIKRGVASATAVMISETLPESGTDNTHDLPSMSLSAATMVDAYLGWKDGATATTSVTMPSGYTQNGSTQLSANSNQTGACLATSTADIASGALPSAHFTMVPSGATQSHAVTMAVAYSPVSSTTSARIYTDTTLTNVTAVGAGSVAAAISDGDPSTYASFKPLSGTPCVYRGNIRNGDGSPLSSPGIVIRHKFYCPAGTTTVAAVVKLYINGALQATYAADTTVSGTEGSFSHPVLSADQTAQVGHFDSIDYVLSVTGS